MRHARPEALDRLEPLLVSLRALPGLNERARGVFYRKSKAFLHFHEDGEDLYADVRLAGADFQRLRVTSQKERAALLKAVGDALAG
jgi:hypothetical protein